MMTKNRLKTALKVVAVLLAIFVVKAIVKENRKTRVLEESVQIVEAAPSDPLKPTVMPKMIPVKKIKLDPTRSILIQGPIGANISEAAQMISQMNEESTTEPIFVILNSPGGSVLDGGLFISAMESSRAPIYTVCVRVCASMAAMIHQYGDKRMAVKRAIIMFHPASGGAEGEVDKMASRINMIQKYILKIEKDVASRMGLTLAQYKEKSGVEYWVDAEDGARDNVVDELVSIQIEVGSAAPQFEEEGVLNRTIRW